VLGGVSEFVEGEPAEGDALNGDVAAAGLFFDLVSDHVVIRRDQRNCSTGKGERGKQELDMTLLVDEKIDLEILEIHADLNYQMVETLPFMPPEQVIDAWHLRPSADLFAAAATLYNIVTGRFIRDFTKNRNAIIRQAVQVPPIPIRDRPPFIAAVIDKALSMDPKDRYQNATDIRDALRSAATQCGFEFSRAGELES
jgi:serine/threonine protein kinase